MSQQVVSVKVYTAVFVTLLLLLALTVAAVQIEGRAIGLASSLVIATVKASLIVLFFMHVRYDKPIVRLAAAAGFLWLAILLALTMGDLASRNWPPTGALDSHLIPPRYPHH